MPEEPKTKGILKSIFGKKDKNELSKKEAEEKEKNLVTFVYDMLGKAANWKYLYSGQQQKTWLDDIKIYKGAQATYTPYLTDGNPTDNQISTFSENAIWELIQSEVPFMLDSNPRVQILPGEPSDTTFVDVLVKIIEQKWIDMHMQSKLAEAVYSAKQVGTAYLKPYWNPRGANGIGDIDGIAVDPLHVFPFPYTKSFEYPEGIITANFVSRAWIKEHFPDKYNLVKPGTKGSQYMIDRDKQTSIIRNNKNTRVQSTDSEGVETNYIPNNYSINDSSDTARIGYVEMLLRDGTTEEFEEEFDNENGEKDTRKSHREVYPYGRIVRVAEGVLLEDIKNKDKYYPDIVDMKNYIQPHEFFGESDIIQIKQNQVVMNDFYSTIVKGVRRGIMPAMFLNRNAEMDADDVYTTPDAVFETDISDPISIRTINPPPPQAFAFTDQIFKSIQRISGAFDYTPPTSGNLPSGSALEQINEIRQTRLKQKVRNMEQSIGVFIKRWIILILENYTEERTARYVNPQDGSQQFILLFREKDKEVAANKIKEATQPRLSDPNNPESEQIPPQYKHAINLEDVDPHLDVVVANGSTVITSRIASAQLSLDLQNRGLIDQKAVLDNLKYPNREEIMDRMARAAQEQAQAQAQSEAAAEAAKNQPDKPGTDVKVNMKGEDIPVEVRMALLAQNAQQEQQPQGVGGI